jgi:hypothetical protein
MRAIQSPFDFHRRSAKSRADFFPGHSPAVSVPTHGVIFCHFASQAHAQNFFQAMFSTQSSMGIARVTRGHGEALFPLGNKARLQKVIRCFQGVDSRQTHFLHQTALESLEQPLDAPFRLRTLRRDPFDPQFLEGSSELRACSFSAQLFRECGRPSRPEDAVFIGVMRQRTSVTPQPSLQRSQVLFRGVVFGKTGPDPAGSVID